MQTTLDENQMRFTGTEHEVPQMLKEASEAAERYNWAIKDVKINTDMDSACEAMESTVVVKFGEHTEIY